MDDKKSVISDAVRDLELKLGRRPKVMVTKIRLDGHDRARGWLLGFCAMWVWKLFTQLPSNKLITLFAKLWMTMLMLLGLVH